MQTCETHQMMMMMMHQMMMMMMMGRSAQSHLQTTQARVLNRSPCLAPMPT